jgi:hypothetical protein
MSIEERRRTHGIPFTERAREEEASRQKYSLHHLAESEAVAKVRKSR